MFCNRGLYSGTPVYGNSHLSSQRLIQKDDLPGLLYYLGPSSLHAEYCPRTVPVIQLKLGEVSYSAGNIQPGCTFLNHM